MEDFPTLGRPTMVMWGRSSSSSEAVSTGSASRMASIRSPVPLPDIDEMQ